MEEWGPAWGWSFDGFVQENPLNSSVVRAACPSNACEPGGPAGIGPPWAIFCCFFWGWNGTVANMTNGSFWGTQNGPPGGGTSQWPAVAGDDVWARASLWGSPTDAVLHAFHDR